jgi:NAD(P) transhydrogenase subunit beta
MKIVVELSYFLAMISFIVGLKFLSSPQKAKIGNLIASIGMTIAILATIVSVFYKSPINLNLILIIIAIGSGIVIGKLMADRAEMTKMPQLVSFFNAMGGGCALLIGIIEGQQISQGENRIAEVVLMSAMVIGAASFSGSIIAYLKLAGKQKDVRSSFVATLSKFLLLLIVLVPTFASFELLNLTLIQEIVLLALLSFVYGLVFVLPIGGADMPVVISLLNSFTGLATALAGIMFHNLLMVSGGIFVGAAGVLLTLLMCKAMNRSIWMVLSGKFKQTQKGETIEMDIKRTTVGEVTSSLIYANKVAIIPGYGLAVAQAQHLCRNLEILLTANNTEVDYIIHPVAGRMPGHMNVLLAEADVQYESLKEMEEVNETMSQYDVAIVIGANDVVNPAAENDENSPIFGMPIIKAYDCEKIIVIKRGMAKGYAGIENILFNYPNCDLLFGDAKTVLTEIISELKNLEE